MPFQLTVHGTQTPPRTLLLKPGANLVGRSARADVSLSGPLVSRTHAKLVVDANGTINLYDLDSNNGTFVNGEKIRTRVINPGDNVYVGGFRLSLEKAAAQDADDAGPVTVESMKLLDKTVATLAAARRGEALATRDAGGFNLALLARVAETLRRHTTAQEHSDHLLRILKDALQAPFAMLLTGTPQGMTVSQVAGDPTGEPPFSQGLARRSMRDSMAYFSRERAAEPELADAPNLPGVPALLSVPLVAAPGAAPVGVVQVVRVFSPGGFSDVEVEAALLLCHIMATRLAAPNEVLLDGGPTESHGSNLESALGGGGLTQEDVRAVMLKAVPEELADRMLAAIQSHGKVQPGYQSGPQVMVFYDLHGFEAWASRQPVENVAHMVGALSTAAASVASSFGGRLDQAMGAGGFLRFWEGTPAEVAEAAVRAAMDLRARVQGELVQPGAALALRAGVDSGPVVAGVFGDGGRATYTVVGSPARVAERVAEMAGHGEVYITSAVRSAMADAAGWRLVTLGPHAVRGRPEAVDLYRVDGAPAGQA